MPSDRHSLRPQSSHRRRHGLLHGQAMSCNTRRCRKAPSLAAASSKWGAKAPSTIFSALAMRPGATAVTSAAARPMLQLARKVFDDSIIVRPWRKPATRWLASVSDALRRNPATGIAGCCALRERPRSRRAANQRDELAASHCPMPPVPQTKVSTALLRCGFHFGLGRLRSTTTELGEATRPCMRAVPSTPTTN